MEKAKNYIGVVLFDNNLQITRTLSYYQTIAESINDLAENYENLNIGAFNKKVFHDIVKHRVANINQRYFSIVEDQMKKAGITLQSLIESQKQASINLLKDFEKKVNSFFDNYQIIQQSYFLIIDIQLEKIHFVDNRAVITDEFKQQIKHENQTSIQTEGQSKYYAKFLALKKAYDELFSESKKYYPEVNASWLLDFDNENNLSLAPNMINFIP